MTIIHYNFIYFLPMSSLSYHYFQSVLRRVLRGSALGIKDVNMEKSAAVVNVTPVPYQHVYLVNGYHFIPMLVGMLI